MYKPHSIEEHDQKSQAKRCEKALARSDSNAISQQTMLNRALATCTSA
jgi:hypothetical protein